MQFIVLRDGLAGQDGKLSFHGHILTVCDKNPLLRQDVPPVLEEASTTALRTLPKNVEPSVRLLRAVLS